MFEPGQRWMYYHSMFGQTFEVAVERVTKTRVYFHYTRGNPTTALRSMTLRQAEQSLLPKEAT